MSDADGALVDQLEHVWGSIAALGEQLQSLAYRQIAAAERDAFRIVRKCLGDQPGKVGASYGLATAAMEDPLLARPGATRV